jgi:hypothetical protein
VEKMARPLRIEFEDAIYHLCTRDNARQMIFRDERGYARFLELLGESAQRFEAAILCFVLMGKPFSFGGANALTESVALDALAAGFLHGLF